MAKFCPEWVFSASVAGVASGFLSGNAPLSIFANQFSNGINEHYTEIKPEIFEESATHVLNQAQYIFVGSRRAGSHHGA